MAKDGRKVCFVVMGFGKKTDYESGRTLDLDATYDAIIKPAVDRHNLRCIRADELMHSGIIDLPMYEMLLRADLVIADISTGNVNAVYELGVRHGLRPNATIVMKEAEGKLHFDLDHVNTLQYQHLLVDIGAKEAARASALLSETIAASLISNKPDSPVYTFLARLKRPQLTDEKYEELLEEAEETEGRLSNYIRKGQSEAKASNHAASAEAFRSALAMKNGDPYLTQQLALATYKAKLPSDLSALIDALAIISELNPNNSNDPETLGITGSIYKQLWDLSKNVAELDRAIRYYGRGFEVRRDYYNGENLATCLDLRSQMQDSADEQQYDRMRASKIRGELRAIVEAATTDASFAERSDKHWVYATGANVCFALGDMECGSEFERLFYAEIPADWEVESYRRGKRRLSEGSAN